MPCSSKSLSFDFVYSEDEKDSYKDCVGHEICDFFCVVPVAVYRITSDIRAFQDVGLHANGTLFLLGLN